MFQVDDYYYKIPKIKKFFKLNYYSKLKQLFSKSYTTYIPKNNLNFYNLHNNII